MPRFFFNITDLEKLLKKGSLKPKCEKVAFSFPLCCSDLAPLEHTQKDASALKIGTIIVRGTRPRYITPLIRKYYALNNKVRMISRTKENTLKRHDDYKMSIDSSLSN